jgi:ABC-type transport system involved in cytochrome c biogenesis permease component
MNAIALGWNRATYETRLYFRQGDTIFFTFLFPVVMLSIFSVAFSASGNVGTNPDGSGGITQAAYYLPGMIAAGILLSGVQNLAVDIAIERGDGTLKRLGGTPLPVLSYFLGKIGQVLITSILQIALLLLIARFAFDVELPTDGDRWMTFLWVYLLGIFTSAVLGIALSRIQWRLHRLLHASRLAAERGLALPVEVDGAGYAGRVLARELRGPGTRGRMGTRRCCDRAGPLVGCGPCRLTPHVPVDQKGQLTLVARSTFGASGWWDVFFVATMTLLVAILLRQWPQVSSADVGALVTVGGVSLSYAALRGVARRDERAALVLAAILVTGAGIATAFHPSMATIQVIAFPLIWSFLEDLRRAVIANVAPGGPRVGVLAGRRGGRSHPGCHHRGDFPGGQRRPRYLVHPGRDAQSGTTGASRRADRRAGPACGTAPRLRCDQRTGAAGTGDSRHDCAEPHRGNHAEPAGATRTRVR